MVQRSLSDCPDEAAISIPSDQQRSEAPYGGCNSRCDSPLRTKHVTRAAKRWQFSRSIDHADRVKTRCLAAASVLQVTEDHERHRVTPQIALIDRAGALSEATRSVHPVRSDQARVAGLLSLARPSPLPSICQRRQG